MNRIGLIGLHDLAAPLSRAGLQVFSDPDLQQAVAVLNQAVREHGPLPVLLRNSRSVASLIPLIHRQVHLTVVGTVTYPCPAEAEGYTTYQLERGRAASLADVVKNAGLDLEPGTIPDALELDADGELRDASDWSSWTPDPPARRSAPEPGNNDDGPGTDTLPQVENPYVAIGRAAQARLQREQDSDWQKYPYGPPSNHRPRPGSPPAASTDVAPATAAAASDRPASPEVPKGPNMSGAAQRTRTRLRAGDQTGLAEVVLCLSGSGGTGKTTTAMSVAERAAVRGVRTIFIDGSPGQGDVGTYLRVAGRLPTMYEAVATGDLTAALVGPDELNRARSPRATPVHFVLLQAPTDIEARTGRVTPIVINQLIDDARRVADLVVVDTQIVELDDPRGMVADMILPQLGRGGWAVAIAALSSAGMANLIRVMTELQRAGINPSHVLSMLSRIPAEVSFAHDVMVEAFQEISVHLGTAWADNEVMTTMNDGDVPAELPVLAHLADTVLLRVLGLEVAAPPYNPYAADQPVRRRWSRLLPRPRGL